MNSFNIQISVEQFLNAGGELVEGMQVMSHSTMAGKHDLTVGKDVTADKIKKFPLMYSTSVKVKLVDENELL